MPRPARSGPASPLFAFGVILTAAGAVLPDSPDSPGLPLLALGALALATAAAVWIAARRR
ncbi:hypothetical protein OS965_38150 [Streptomyces sp. H27-G5]|uniref:hypothetical protein n=1 Tax=Streptomyces sp. H27-G5 TaxID=2996698 RepID=UPI00226D8FB1|nr:hypothetical protein [Streptomyces sp. H27-G5]MCY0923889.1 hypothetical protein [Streptomyces sp. H27-G5]